MTNVSEPEFKKILECVKRELCRIPVIRCRKFYSLQSVKDGLAAEFGKGHYLDGICDYYINGVTHIDLQLVFYEFARDCTGLVRVLKAIESLFDVDTANFHKEIRQKTRIDDTIVIARILGRIEAILIDKATLLAIDHETLENIRADIAKLSA